jgi:hypothetical protein
VIKKSARRVLGSLFYARDTKNEGWRTRWRHKKWALERGYVLNFDRSLDSLFGLKNYCSLESN